MNRIIVFFLALLPVFLSCNLERQEEPQPAIVGTWRLITGTTIKEGDTTIVDYTKGQEMQKIITPSHFSFMRHDLNHGIDSAAIFVAGGGRVKITEKTYAEYLDYCNYREWEGGEFEFTYQIVGDTLTTTGLEKVEKLGINHINIERLVRVRTAASGK